MNDTLISADDHIDLGYLPRDLWTARFPSTLRERAPRVVDRGGGDERWICEGNMWGEWRGGNWFSRAKATRVITALDRGGVAEDFTLRPTTPDLRLADMDRDGVEVSVMFPPILQMKASEPQLAKAVIQAYNDWAADFAAASPRRLFSIAQMFPESAEDSTEELLRVAHKGMRQVSFLVGTVNERMYRSEWDSFWAAAADSGVLVSYHIGGSGGFPAGPATHFGFNVPPESERDDPWPAFGMGFEASRAFYEPLVRLFSFGILARHPGLKIVLAESGCGWIPWLVQDMDFRYRGMVEKRGLQGAALKVPPSELFRRQVWVTYQEDAVGLKLTEYFGEDKLMWASDYPHPDSTWPNSRAIVDKETANLPANLRKKILYENARALYL